MAKRSLIILVFTIKALIIIPALSACSACLVTYTRMRKNRGLDSSFPCRVSQRAVRVPAGQCHSTGRPGLKLAEPWREAGNLLTRLASRAERCSERGINKKPSRAFQQAHQGLWEARPAGSLAGWKPGGAGAAACKADPGSYFYRTESAASFTGNKHNLQTCFSKFKCNISTHQLFNYFKTFNWIFKIQYLWDI